MGKVAHVKRVPITLNITLETREALDRKVAEGRAKGFPVERASLAAHLLSVAVSGSAVDVEALEELAGKLDVAALQLARSQSLNAEQCKGLGGSLQDRAMELRAAIRTKEASDG